VSDHDRNYCVVAYVKEWAEVAQWGWFDLETAKIIVCNLSARDDVFEAKLLDAEEYKMWNNAAKAAAS
jgi:hypothetical protein